MHRSDNLKRLQSEHFDICIIGGGASGAGCALDAALRGFRVALIEKNDFASETSSRSTKLIHGGVRYLEQAFKNLDFGQLRQVRHGLEERYTVIKNAPHLARPQALLTPVSNLFQGIYLAIGLRIYDWFSGKNDPLPKSRWLSKKEALKRMPGLNPKKLHSAVLYFDGQHNDARYALALAHTAEEAGAAVANHLEVTGFRKDDSGKLIAVLAKDRFRLRASQLSEVEGRLSEVERGLSEVEIKARLFINCTGPFADSVRRMANPTLEARIRPSKGVHVMLPYETLGSRDAMLIPKTPDGRVVFAIPFEGKVLLGTTDEDYPNPDREPTLEKREVDFLLNTLAPYLSEPLAATQVTSGFGGLRPLIAAQPGKSTKRLVRDHEVEHDPVSNLLSLLGGKWTTYRLMARDTIDRACELLGRQAACTTQDTLLVGAPGFRENGWQDLEGLPEDVARHLSLAYGDRAPRVAHLAARSPVYAERLAPGHPFIKAEVAYQVAHEMAHTLRDVLGRRMRLEIVDWNAAKTAAPAVATLLGDFFEWGPERIRMETEEYIRMVDGWMDAATRE